jgi:hypothetical protein
VPGRRPEPGGSVADSIAIVPANEASWEDLQAIFGMRGYTVSCHCQRFKVGGPRMELGGRLRAGLALRVQTGCGHPDAPTTSGLVA